MKRIGIFGGTFDPPHIGHLIMAEEVRAKKNLDEVWFIPTKVPPHKAETMTDHTHRTAMLKTAIDGCDYFKVNTIEAERIGKSYTIDTIKSLRAAYPSNEFYFIIGGDMVAYLPKWHAIDELITLIDFIGVHRQGYSLEESVYPVQRVDMPIIDISSTDIKARIINKQPIRYFLPNGVYTYIKEHHLYGL